jgi:hypothetical protein
MSIFFGRGRTSFKGFLSFIVLLILVIGGYGLYTLAKNHKSATCDLTFTGSSLVTVLVQNNDGVTLTKEENIGGITGKIVYKIKKGTTVKVTLTFEPVEGGYFWEFSKYDDKTKQTTEIEVTSGAAFDIKVSNGITIYHDKKTVME